MLSVLKYDVLFSEVNIVVFCYTIIITMGNQQSVPSSVASSGSEQKVVNMTAEQYREFQAYCKARTQPTTQSRTTTPSLQGQLPSSKPKSSSKSNYSAVDQSKANRSTIRAHSKDNGAYPRTQRHVGRAKKRS